MLVALVIALLFTLLLLPLFMEAVAAPEADMAIRSCRFITLFAVTYLLMYLGYGYWICIESDLQQPQNRTLMVQSFGHSVATSIPMESIVKVTSIIYRDLPDDLYAIRQNGYQGEGVLLHYRLSARHGDGSGKQHRIWFPLCNDQQLRHWLKLPDSFL
ncbi:hypothetical protein A3193_04280 [Candidatus Thiodiazotropha endoloripes]|uniref:hypothetical protein n=1 Tax=Candidatus Thiodiazotropha endoloripes TaxID=1818881 RepID=UPI00083E1851|nr:hypothetical protein [Candidatus Thiodiazotropha endoloripes]ODB88104.1 hypothetical protein A3193_04280 [Candidatus Thiodiazotropha endoloripes]